MATLAVNRESASPTKSSANTSAALLAAFGCFCFGLCMIMNSQVRSDGTWPLYADRLLHGAKLYSDLHTPLQPFFYLEVTAWERFAGNSWLSGLFLPIVHLLLFVIGYYIVTTQSELSPTNKAIFLVAAFAVAIGFSFYNFADFHVVSDIQYLYSTILILRYHINFRHKLTKPLICVSLGVLAGVSFTTRANEGLLLYIADLAVLFAIAKVIRWRAMFYLTVGFFVTCLIMILATGDSIGAYFDNALAGTAGIKGGPAQLLMDPIYLLREELRQIVLPEAMLALVLTGFIIAVPVALALAVAKQARLGRKPILILIAGVSLAVDVGVATLAMIADPYFALLTLTPFLVLALIVAGGTAAMSVVGVISDTHPSAPVVLLPAAMLVAESLSSGGHAGGQYAPLGLFIALAPALYPSAFEVGWVRIPAIGVCGALAVFGLVAKIILPVQWLFYQAPPMFVGREWISHPIYGPMYIPKSDNEFFARVCGRVGGYRANTSLLSTPFSFASYYCGIPPWRNYVQTWFDTSSPSSIQNLDMQLQINPPSWILYERQLIMLRIHERIYAHGGRIPYRGLDELIMSKINRGDWKVELTNEPRPGDVWMLIRTSPPSRSPPP